MSCIGGPKPVSDFILVSNISISIPSQPKIKKSNLCIGFTINDRIAKIRFVKSQPAADVFIIASFIQYYIVLAEKCQNDIFLNNFLRWWDTFIKIFFVVESTKGQKSWSLRIALSKEFSPILVGDDTIPQTQNSRKLSIGKRSHFIRHRSSTTADTLLVHPWLYSTTPRGHLIHRPMIGLL